MTNISKRSFIVSPLSLLLFCPQNHNTQRKSGICEHHKCERNMNLTMKKATSLRRQDKISSVDEPRTVKKATPLQRQSRTSSVEPPLVEAQQEELNSEFKEGLEVAKERLARFETILKEGVKKITAAIGPNQLYEWYNSMNRRTHLYLTRCYKFIENCDPKTESKERDWDKSTYSAVFSPIQFPDMYFVQLNDSFMDDHYDDSNVFRKAIFYCFYSPVFVEYNIFTSELSALLFKGKATATAVDLFQGLIKLMDEMERKYELAINGYIDFMSIFENNRRYLRKRITPQHSAQVPSRQLPWFNEKDSIETVMKLLDYIKSNLITLHKASSERITIEQFLTQFDKPSATGNPPIEETNFEDHSQPKLVIDTEMFLKYDRSVGNEDPTPMRTTSSTIKTRQLDESDLSKYNSLSETTEERAVISINRILGVLRRFVDANSTFMNRLLTEPEFEDLQNELNTSLYRELYGLQSAIMVGIFLKIMKDEYFPRKSLLH